MHQVVWIMPFNLIYNKPGFNDDGTEVGEYKAFLLRIKLYINDWNSCGRSCTDTSMDGVFM